MMIDDLAPLGVFTPTRAPEPGTPQFIADVEACEAEPYNAAGTDKLWVERIQREVADWHRTAVFEKPTRSEFAQLIVQFEAHAVQSIVIGVYGANLHARGIGHGA